MLNHHQVRDAVCTALVRSTAARELDGRTRGAERLNVHLRAREGRLEPMVDKLHPTMRSK